MDKDENLLEGIEYAKDIGYAQYLARGEDETRVYICGGIPVELTLPKGKHGYYSKIFNSWYGGCYQIDENDKSHLNFSWREKPMINY